MEAVGECCIVVGTVCLYDSQALFLASCNSIDVDASSCLVISLLWPELVCLRLNTACETIRVFLLVQLGSCVFATGIWQQRK